MSTKGLGAYKERRYQARGMYIEIGVMMRLFVVHVHPGRHIQMYHHHVVLDPAETV